MRNTAKWSSAALEPEPGARDAWHTALQLGRRLMGLESLDLAQVDGLVLRQFASLALGKSRWREDLELDDVLDEHVAHMDLLHDLHGLDQVVGGAHGLVFDQVKLGARHRARA